jgi:hypothetical protein
MGTPESGDALIAAALEDAAEGLSPREGAAGEEALRSALVEAMTQERQLLSMALPCA